MSKLVTIYGGSGFVGRYIARRMAKAGWRVRVAVRRPNEAIFVKPYGVVGQVEPVFCNIRDDQSVASVMTGADAVVNCVGVLASNGKNTFEAVQGEGATRIARIAAEQGIETMVHLSSIGADASAESEYQQTKAEGEAGVLKHMPNATILRPSIIFGSDDSFFNRFAGMTRFGPILPVIGAGTKFQPVHVDDVAQAAELALSGQAAAGVYELGGPDVHTFRDLMTKMLGVIHRRRLVLNMPFWVARIMGFAFDMANAMSLGLVPAMVTRDQVKTLKNDNVVSNDALGFDDLGIEPVALDAVLPEYLWPYRPSGQYDDIKNSARNLQA
ncbi:MAG: complex I NDUFA9 subunit family protein [Paracoccaceae bacterium]